MVRNVKSSLYQRLVKCIATVPSERCEKIEFGSLSKIVVIPLFSRGSTFFVEEHYTTWKRHLPSSNCFFYFQWIWCFHWHWLYCWKRAKIYEIFWLIRQSIQGTFFKFIPYVVIKMSENFNNLEEDITRKARVNFDCKCYKLIKCKPSLQDDSYHSETLANLLAYFGQKSPLIGLYS